MRALRPLEDGFWLEVAPRSGRATFFHTPHWRDLALGASPELRDATVGAELSDGTRVVLPLLETGRSTKGFHRHLISTFGGCYGGMIADSPLPDGLVAETYAALLGQRVGSLEMTGNPLAGAHRMPQGFESRPYSTHLVSLTEGWDGAQRRFSRGNRSSINRGRREGVTSRLAVSLDDYRSYYDVYERTLKRWGDRATSRYPWHLFEQGHDLGRHHPENMRLWLAGKDETVMAGAWVFYWNRHAVYWHGATDDRFSSSRPANVLHADIIKDSCERGYRWYDFNPSGGHEGVARFKSSFGSHVEPIDVWSYKSTSAEVVQTVKRILK